MASKRSKRGSEGPGNENKNKSWVYSKSEHVSSSVPLSIKICISPRDSSQKNFCAYEYQKEVCSDTNALGNFRSIQRRLAGGVAEGGVVEDWKPLNIKALCQRSLKKLELLWDRVRRNTTTKAWWQWKTKILRRISVCHFESKWLFHFDEIRLVDVKLTSG